MTRFALVLTAILMLTLSAGLTSGRPRQMPPSTSAAAVGFRDIPDAFQVKVVAQHKAPASLARRSPTEEPPAPALLIYLGLILVGSVVAVLLMQQRMQPRREAP